MLKPSPQLIRLSSFILLIGLLAGLVVLVLQNTDTNRALALGTNSYGVYTATNTASVPIAPPTCTDTTSLPGGLSFSATEEKKDFNGQTYYKGGLFYCCADTLYQNTLFVQGCENAELEGDPTKDPWFSSSQADVNLVTSVLTPSTPAAGTYFNTNVRQSSRSEFLYSTRTTPTTIPTNQLSYQGDLLFDYGSAFYNTPVASNFGTDWYGYIKKLVEVNLANISSTRRIVNITSTVQAAGGKLSGNVGPFTDTAVLIQKTAVPTLTVESGSKCNTKVIIFVEGDLVLTPSFKLNNRNITVGQGCMFIVQGNVIIEGGNPGTKKADAASYDELEVGVFSNGIIHAKYDDKDGLYVKGFMSGGLGKFERDTESQSHPSLWVEYDPRFVELFKDELKLLKFSTREKGFVSSLQ